MTSLFEDCQLPHHVVEFTAQAGLLRQFGFDLPNLQPKGKEAALLLSPASVPVLPPSTVTQAARSSSTIGVVGSRLGHGARDHADAY